MVSEDYLGLNDQLVFGCVSLQAAEITSIFSNYNAFIQLVAFETFGYRPI